MDINYFSPYALDGNLAREYNRYIKMCKPGDYAVFFDRDTWFTQAKYGHLINDIIEKHGQAYYTAVTNRVNCRWQKINAEGNDRYHVEVGKVRQDDYGLSVVDSTDKQLWSGVCMICPVDLWIPLPEKKGLLGCDNQIHANAKKQGAKVYLIPSLYLWHWYSGYDGESGHRLRNKDHLV